MKNWLLAVILVLGSLWTARSWSPWGEPPSATSIASVGAETPELDAFGIFQPRNDPRVVELTIGGNRQDIPSRLVMFEMVNRGKELRPKWKVALRTKYTAYMTYSTSNGRFYVTIDEMVPFDGTSSWSLTDHSIVVYDLLQGTSKTWSLKDLFGAEFMSLFPRAEGTAALDWWRCVSLLEDDHILYVHLNFKGNSTLTKSVLRVDLLDQRIERKEVSDIGRLGNPDEVQREKSCGEICWSFRAPEDTGDSVPLGFVAGREPKEVFADCSSPLLSAEMKEFLGGRTRLAYRWDESRQRYVLQQ